MKRDFSCILVTGGAGFIGANFIRYVFYKTEFRGIIVNVDKLTYSANLKNLEDIERDFKDRYYFEKVDICDRKALDIVFKEYAPDCVVHFAAESHVDRSILGPEAFIKTNIFGTFNLLELAKKYWIEKNSLSEKLFHHVSTDEVYGSLGKKGYFYETTPYGPRSPYSASKAGSDHLVRAYFHTYNLPVTISNCSNNYGPFQFPEKLIPLMILNMLEEKPLPVYGDGKNVRDWLYVEDHCSAVWMIISESKVGETYNIGGENEWENIKLVKKLCEIVAEKNGKKRDYYKRLISFVKDRPGHDKRYAIKCDKIKKTLKWARSVSFEEGLKVTVDWYLKNEEWIKSIKSGEYHRWIKKNYKDRKK